MALDGLVVLTVSLPKLSEVTDTAAANTPVPLSVTVFGLLLALVPMVSDPAGSAPNAVGVNVTEMVQLEFAARGTDVLHVAADTA